MKRLFLPIIFIVGVVLMGCDEANNTVSSNSDKTVNTSMTNNISLHSNKVASNASPEQIEKNVLEEAQRNYQNSYNEYVRCLREKGPQTIETLQALTQYQKHYQIYQMLLNAETKE